MSRVRLTRADGLGTVSSFRSLAVDDFHPARGTKFSEPATGTILLMGDLEIPVQEDFAEVERRFELAGAYTRPHPRYDIEETEGGAG